MTDSNTANAYLRTKVLTASREELRLLLLDGAIKFAQQAREGLASNNHEQAFDGFGQCRDIVMELMNTIRTELAPELGEQVRSLYAFLYGELVAASFDRDIPRLDKAIELIEYERETWVQAMAKLAAERVEQGAAPTSTPTAGDRPSLSIQA